MTPEKFCFITTEAVDYIHFPDHTKVEEAGGTQLFYRLAVERLAESSDNFIWISPLQKTEVHIYPLENYGYGENDSTIDPAFLSERLDSLDNPIVIVSTTLRTDFDLELLKPYAEKFKYLFIDVQGFTRDGRRHNFFDIPEWLLGLPNVVFKVGEEELPYVNLQKIQENENAIVLYTRGKRGFTVVKGKSSVEIEPSEVIEREDQEFRGAGDTLLLNFAHHYVQYQDLMSAATYAERSVVNFLKEK